MKFKAMFRRTGFALAPIGKDARELLAGIREGNTVLVEVWKPRNWKQHRKFFAILNNVVEATGRWTSAEHLRRDLLLSLHRYDEHVNGFTGEVVKVPHSMAFAAMPKDEFERLYEDAMTLLTDALGCDPEMLTEEMA